MPDSDAAVNDRHDWGPQGFRARLGSRLERHVLRSAVDMLDERGTELDSIDRELRDRETNLVERYTEVEEVEEELEHREKRLEETGAANLEGQARIDHLIRQLDRAETALGEARAAGRAGARRRPGPGPGAAGPREAARGDRAPPPAHPGGHHEARVDGFASRERELRDQNEKLRRRTQEAEAKQHGLFAQENRLAERERRVTASEADLRARLDAVERRERELEEREEGLRGKGSGWWNAGPASSH